MKYISPAFKWLNKNYFHSNENKFWFKLKVSFSEPVNFLVHYPISDKHCLIKEYVKNEWIQEVALIDPAKTYIKVFLTTNNQIKELKVKLDIEQITDIEPKITLSETFHINESHNLNDWLQIKWSNQDV